tara:strand:+ start:282 stop:752 length:471 start_codon:yes stop_codon:yes gene_type:complete
MQYTANTIKEYIDQLPEEQQGAITQLRAVINNNSPTGFSEIINYSMPSWVVPHSLYPSGYHCDPSLPLPFLSIASQKNFVALYHMGIYANPKLMDWFVNEYPKHCPSKLDMGKSCIRFKKVENIPYELVGELAAKMTPEDCISLYESAIKDSRKRN